VKQTKIHKKEPELQKEIRIVKRRIENAKAEVEGLTREYATANTRNDISWKNEANKKLDAAKKRLQKELKRLKAIRERLRLLI